MIRSGNKINEDISIFHNRSHILFQSFLLCLMFYFSLVLFICRGAEAVSPAAQSATASATMAEEQTPILRKGHSAHIRPSQINAIHDLTFGEVLHHLKYFVIFCLCAFVVC